MKRLLFAGIFILITLFSFSAEVIRYVDPDATGTGTGLDWTNAYTSLSAWNTGEATNLVADGDWHHVYCRASSGTADTTTMSINGWTTGSTHYILIEAADGDEALKDEWDDTRYAKGATNETEITVTNDYVEIKGLQISGRISITATTDIYNCRLKGTSSVGINISNSTTTVNIWNTIMTGTYYDGIVAGTSTTVNVYNSVLAGATSDSIEYNSASGTCKNVVCYGAGTDFDIDGGSTVTVDYCAGVDGTGTNSVSFSGSDIDNELTDVSTGDMTLLNTGNFYHGGASAPDSSLYTTDMEGDSYYSTAYSIGVDEYVAASTGIAVLRRRIMGYSSVFNFTNLLLLLNTISGYLLTHTMMKLRRVRKELLWYAKPENIKNLAIVEKYLEETHV